MLAFFCFRPIPVWCDQEKQGNWSFVKTDLDIDQAYMKAFTQFHDKNSIMSIIYVKKSEAKLFC